ncbi:NAD-dependent succinate-semialdehyde dehydrogenase [Chamaesiphon minutus]|uniref:NAD-dependent aldehyde dehydrogenase n=1 Tax=Chamaesiphon minutus (strain ATCC 27169 / PCC 6605) TaxID=1173020 RepID=K9UCL6_CHAP6|nr:NAD-dependent succinate-semialdehyde dehydrogenase [Chamaesiphon minutus]AFY91954.1 NAD-dependent aldehyde dehydrogenase [Chamaesiphon minutus PCC 6605]
MSIASINPTTGQQLKNFPALTDDLLRAKIIESERVFQDYRQTSWAQRSQWLHQAASLLRDDRQSLAWAKLMTLEMGKPIDQAIAEIQKCALVCDYYAEYGAEFLAPEIVATDASQSRIEYHPLGTILAVMPWNFPFWQVFRFAAPTLMAGNVALLKHASNVPQCAIAIEDILLRAGFPPGVFQTLLISADRVESIVKSPQVKAATLTGSEPAGASLAQAAGTVLKKIVLELGGSDPFIVTTSADLDEAVAVGVKARLLNNGQSCIAAKRFIVLEDIADVFTTKFVEAFRQLQIGDPLQSEINVGPLATRTGCEQLDAQVQTSIAGGAECLIGGKPWSGLPGFFYEPTILKNIPPTCATYRDEFFGPVALLFTVPDLDAAIALANDSPFGLGASAWTQDATERDRLISQLDVGSVFINGMVKSDPRLPFGGIKRSGYGRELGRPGILEFVNIKTIWIK